LSCRPRGCRRHRPPAAGMRHGMSAALGPHLRGDCGPCSFPYPLCKARRE
jgi:hypothetical protein